MDDLKIGLLLKNAVTTRLSTLTQLCSMTRLAKKGTTATTGLQQGLLHPGGQPQRFQVIAAPVASVSHNPVKAERRV